VHAIEQQQQLQESVTVQTYDQPAQQVAP